MHRAFATKYFPSILYTCDYTMKCMFMANIFFDVVQGICLGYKMILPRLPPPKMHECHQKKAKFQKGDASFSNHLENLVSLFLGNCVWFWGLKQPSVFREYLFVIRRSCRNGREAGGLSCKNRGTYNTYTHIYENICIFLILYHNMYAQRYMMKYQHK